MRRDVSMFRNSPLCLIQNIENKYFITQKWVGTIYRLCRTGYWRSVPSLALTGDKSGLRTA